MKTIIVTLLFTFLINASLFAQKISHEERVFKRVITNQVEGNIFRDELSNCLLERIDARDFNYEDENIRIAIWPSYSMFDTRIYNKTNREMVCKWTKALWVLNGRSYKLIFFTEKAEHVNAIFAQKFIAPQSYEKYWIKAGTSLYGKRMVKKYGPLFIRLMIPIEVNGKEVVYDLKYKVSYWDWKKEEKERKREKKEKKEKTQ